MHVYLPPHKIRALEWNLLNAHFVRRHSGHESLRPRDQSGRQSTA